jgi:hypothetical protein
MLNQCLENTCEGLLHACISSMCYYFAMQHLSYHNPNPWPVFIQRNDLNTGLFYELVWGGGDLQKGKYYTECGKMTDGCWWQKVWRGIVCTSREVWGVFSPRKFFCIFPPLGLKCEHFLKQIFGYTALHCALIDRIWSVKYFLHGMSM